MVSKVARESRPSKPSKPHRKFPLTANGNGQWSKKIRGRVHYFGPRADPVETLLRALIYLNSTWLSRPES